MWKINNIVATRCHILKLKCTKFNFGWGSAPDPAGAAYDHRKVVTHPDPLAEFKGPTSKGREGRGGVGREREGWKGKGGERGVTSWFLLTPPP